MSAYVLKKFKHWTLAAPPNDVFVYHRAPIDATRDEECFAYARKLSDAGLAFLYQRPIDTKDRAGCRLWEWCAKRSRPQDIAVLDIAAHAFGPSAAVEAEAA